MSEYVRAEEWLPDGRPEGWVREVHTDLRRPDGDPSREYNPRDDYPAGEEK